MNLSLSQLTVTFASGITVFRSFAVDFKGPGLCFITGKNGTGKSTLAHIIAGYEIPHADVSGTVVFNGQRYNLANTHDRGALNNRCFMIDQKTDNMLALHFTVQENLDASCVTRYPRMRFLAHTESSFSALLPPNVSARYLSGGQRQILSLAMACKKNPEVLILDEPTAALDDYNARLVMDAIYAMSRSIVCLCICHDKNLIAHYSAMPSCSVTLL